MACEWGGLPGGGGPGWDLKGQAEFGAVRPGSRLAHCFHTRWEPGSQPTAHLTGITIATPRVPGLPL